MDLTGIDIGYTMAARYAETGDPADAPSATVTALVERGHLGRKTACGYYTYDDTRHQDRGGDMAPTLTDEQPAPRECPRRHRQLVWAVA